MQDKLSAEELSLLMIEPSDTQRKIIMNLLRKEGINNIEEAKDLKSAWDTISAHQPDLIISAMHFKDGSAKDLIKKLKNDDAYKDIPFMLVSSEVRRQHLEEFKQAGAVAILPKPFEPKHLNRAVNATLDLLSTEEMELELFDVEQIKVLLVDDSRTARSHIKRVLTNLGLKHIKEAENGAMALTLIKDFDFDLVVTDYNMPEMDGRELSEFIRCSGNHAHIPILMVTSEASDTHLANIAQSGVNAMVDKPFEPKEVRRLLKSILEAD